MAGLRELPEATTGGDRHAGAGGPEPRADRGARWGSAAARSDSRSTVRAAPSGRASACSFRCPCFVCCWRRDSRQGASAAAAGGGAGIAVKTGVAALLAAGTVTTGAVLKEELKKTPDADAKVAKTGPRRRCASIRREGRPGRSDRAARFGSASDDSGHARPAAAAARTTEPLPGEVGAGPASDHSGSGSGRTRARAARNSGPGGGGGGGEDPSGSSGSGSGGSGSSGSGSSGSGSSGSGSSRLRFSQLRLRRPDRAVRAPSDPPIVDAD